MRGSGGREGAWCRYNSTRVVGVSVHGGVRNVWTWEACGYDFEDRIYSCAPFEGVALIIVLGARTKAFSISLTKS
jgi:hypothetical protein